MSASGVISASHPTSAGFLQVDCSAFSTTITVQCVSEIPDIPDLFLDDSSLLNGDKNTFQNLGGIITNECNQVIIKAEDIIDQFPAMCGDHAVLHRVYSITDGIRREQCTQEYIVTGDPTTEDDVLMFFSSADDIYISCEENVDSILADYIKRIGFADYQHCMPLQVDLQSDPVFRFGGCYDRRNNRNVIGEHRAQFTFSDGCKTFTTVGGVYVQDLNSPELNCPTDTVFNLFEPNLEGDIRTYLQKFNTFDQCGSTSTSIDFATSRIDYDCNPSQTLPITYISRDTCGNFSDCITNITISADLGPQIFCPDTLVVECADPSNRGLINNWIVEAYANDVDGTFLFVQNDFDTTLLDTPFCNQETTIKFETRDDCGFTSFCNSRIVINDLTKPDIACPSDTTLLSADGNLMEGIDAWKNRIEANDACNSVTIKEDLNESLLIFGCVGTEDFLVTFTAEDYCGNTNTCQSTISISNNYLSGTICPMGLTIHCGNQENDLIINSWLDEFKIWDNNLDTIQLSNDLTLSDYRLLSCNEDVTVLFSGTDACNTPYDCISAITTIDTIIPAISCPQDIRLVVDTSDIFLGISNWLLGASATDNCSVETIDNSFDISQIETCDSTITVPVEFTAVDSCGLISSACISNLTLRYNREPSINCPSTLAIECGEDNSLIINNWLQSANSFDFAGTDLVVNNDLVIDSITKPGCNYAVEVNFFSVDNCNRSDSCTTTIMLSDNTPPEAICPNPLDINATDVNYLSKIEQWLSTITSNDNCLSSSVTHDFDTTAFDICLAAEVINVACIATDDCGLTSECSTTININKASPTINCPASLNLICGDSDNSNRIEQWLATSAAQDNNLSNLLVTNDFDITNLEEGCSTELVVQFVTKDSCEVSSSCMASILVEDNISPEIDCPPMLSLIAGDPDIVGTVDQFFESIIVTDCNMTTFTDDLDRSLLDVACQDEVIIPVTFTAEDLCGNQTPCMFDISVKNTVISQITCPPGLSIECGAPDNETEIQMWLNSAIAEDNLGNSFAVNNDFNLTNPGIIDCDGIIAVEFVIVDECNSGTSCVSSITISDTTAPEVTCPSDITLTLDAPNFDSDISNWLSTTTGDDNCGAVNITNNYTPVSSVDDCTGYSDLVITFVGNDPCGYTADCSATIRVESERSPRINNVPSDLDLECGAPDNLNTIRDILSNITGQDFDGTSLNVSNDFAEAQFDALTCNDTLTISFSMTNSCNVINTEELQIRVQDTTNPFIQCPPALSISSTDTDNDAIVGAWLASAVSTDECSNPTISESIDLDTINYCALPDIVEITFTSTDICGLESTCVGEISVTKDLPILNCPSQSLSLECSDNNNDSKIADWLTQASAQDNTGSDLQVINDYSPIDYSNLCSDSIVVLFFVDDLCGSGNNCAARITVSDNTTPEISCPDNVTLDVGSTTLQQEIDDWMEGAFATDNCSDLSGDITNDFDEDLSLLNCGISFLVEYQVSDICGNDNACITELTFGSSAFIDVSCPDPIEIKCTQVYNQSLIDSFLTSYTVVSDDNFILENDFDINQINPNCVESFTRVITFTAIDDCKNRDECETSITFLPDGKIYIPNTFSPNGDNENDIFTVYGNESVEMVTFLNIYNRWGDLVYKSEAPFPVNDESYGWDGRFNNGPVVQGVYVYKLELEDRFGNKILRTGSITVSN